MGTAAVYPSVVSTVKLAGVSEWRFLGDFFEDVVTGGRTHHGASEAVAVIEKVQ